jgi:hypothetical protein
MFLIYVLALAHSEPHIEQMSRLVYCKGNHPTEVITLKLSGFTNKTFKFLVPGELASKVAAANFKQAGETLNSTVRADGFEVQLNSIEDLSIRVDYLGRY